jgi:hypothetical protein
MKLFSCPACEQVVFFSNVVCERCRRALGYEPDSNRMLALEPDAETGFWTAVGRGSNGEGWKYCDNYQYGVCNWLLPADSPETLSLASRFNLVIPDLSDPANVLAWQKMELAKQRLFYTLLRLKLPLATRGQHPEGLGFQFLGDAGGANVMTGHDEGLITIALAEADDAEREKRRHAMGEPYRTLLGHFRHEIGHWYWDILVRDGGALAECRALFGDDSADYGQALQNHYANGPKPDWQGEYVSAYAGSHPWEDFAETWAHYLHIVDTIEVGGAYGLAIHPRLDREGVLTTDLDFKVYADDTTVDQIVDAWLALSGALNSFNRAMGHQDLYPFVLSPTVVGKLGFVHDLVHGRVGRGREVLEEQRRLAA